MKSTRHSHTTKNPFRAGSLSSAALITLTAFAIAGTAQAATKTWNGSNTGNPAWYANTNWTPGVAPVDGDDLVFAGTTLLTHNSYANTDGDSVLELSGITFDNTAGAFTINNGGGGTIKLLGDITNDSTNLQTLNFPFQLNADVTANAAAGDITIGGVISEDGTARSLIKSGSNTLSLTGASTYTGTTDINAGKLQLGNGGTTGSLSTSSAIDIAAGAAFMVNRTDTVTQGTDFSTAAITGAGFVVNAGDGTLVLGANSHTGGARLGYDNNDTESATRVIQVTDSGALGTGTLGFYKSGTFELGADALNISNNVFSGNYSLAGNDKIIKLDLAGTNTGTMSGNIDTRGGNFESFKMDVGTADTLTLSGNIYNGAGGGAGITKIGDGTLIMSGTNTYNGQTRVNAGTLKLSGGSAIEDVRDVFVDASGTLDLNGSSETINRLTGTGTIDNTASNGILTVGHNSATFQFDGTLTDTVGSLRLTKVGAGTLTLTGANTHTFTQIGVNNAVPAGTVSIENNAALGTGDLSYEAGGTLQLGVNGLSVANGIFVGNRADTAARTIQLDLAGSNTGELTGNIDIRVDQVGEFVADVGTDDTLTFSGNLVTGAGGNAGLTKEGAGTLVLSGTNTYTGQTKINSGTLQIDGTHTQAKSGVNSQMVGAMTIDVGGTLAGSGTIAASLLTVNGVIAPGNSPGTLTTGDQLWNDGGTYLWEINDSGGSKGGTTGWDWLDITGDLNLASLSAGGFTIDIDSLTGVSPGDAAGFGTFAVDGYESPFDVDYSFIIASADSITGFNADNFSLDFSGFSALSPQAGWHWEIIESGTDLVLQAYAVPEPSSTALLGLGGLALMLRRKRS